MLAISGGMFAVGSMGKDMKLRRAGLASGEAALHSFVETYLLKLATNRERPFEASKRG